MTGQGNYYDVDGDRSLDQRWPDADAITTVGGPVREIKTDGGADVEDIEQRLARLERIVFDEDDEIATDGGQPTDIIHEVTERDVSDISKAALYVEWSEAYEQLLGTVPDDRRDELWNRRRDLWNEMRDQTDADPPECPECGHTRWQQEFGGPKSCCGCGWAPTADGMGLIDAIDRYWSKVKSIDEDAADQLVTDGGLDMNIEKLGTTKANGESWGEVADRLRDRDDDRWHYCACGARYRSRGPALRCCSERFAEIAADVPGGHR